MAIFEELGEIPPEVGRGQQRDGLQHRAEECSGEGSREYFQEILAENDNQMRKSSDYHGAKNPEFLPKKPQILKK